MKHAPALLLSTVLALVAACESTSSNPATSEPDPEGTGPKETQANAPLEDTEWLLVEVGGKPAIPGVGTRKASVSFGSDSGSVSGNSGLNSFFGPYAVDRAKLRIENLGMTRMGGSPELMEQETAFTAALHAARSWSVRGNSLELHDEKGVAIARLRTAADS